MKNNIAEFKSKSALELKELLSTLLREQFQLRMRQADSETAPKTHQYGQIRKNIARIKTLLNTMGKTQNS